MLGWLEHRQRVLFDQYWRQAQPYLPALQKFQIAKRAEIYHKIQKILVTDSPVVWLTEVQYVTVFNRKLHDATTGPLGTYSAFERAWIEH